MLLIFIGPPGSGKGTIASMLREHHGFETFSIGDALREEVKKGTELGRIINDYISKGNLVTDEIATEIIKKSLDKSKDFILDGYPRNINQARTLSGILDSLNKKIDRVIYFSADEEMLVDRISKRLVCPQCNKVYHKEVQRPKKLWYCDDCQTELIQRQDDNEEAFRHRLVIYHEITEPLIKYYEEKDMIIEIKADLSIEERFQAVKKVLQI